MSTTYPDAGDYIRAVQNPQVAFHDPRLQRARFALDPDLYIPMPAAGTAAVVFRAEIDGTDRALRFYITEEDPDADTRYRRLGRHLATADLPCAAAAVWTDDAITLRQRSWPMVEMPWVEGRTLDTYVGHLAGTGQVGALGTLAAEWRALVATLQRAGFAHGDLQHGNVLVDLDSRFRLVDFDGSWIEDFAGMDPPAESGHPNYQRSSFVWGRWMDTFPGLVVYTALLGMARYPGRWPADRTEDKILFSQDDFASFTTPTWHALGEIDDPQVRHAAAVLRTCCAPGWVATGPLEDLLREAVTVAFRPPVPAVPDNRPWWQRIEDPVAGAPSPVEPAPNPTPLPPPPEVVQPGPPGWAGDGRTGTTPVPGWHRLGAPTGSPPGRPPGPPTGRPAGPPWGGPFGPTGQPPVRRPDWLRPLLLALLCGAALGLLTGIIVAGSGNSGHPVLGATVTALLFTGLLLPMLRRRS